MDEVAVAGERITATWSSAAAACGSRSRPRHRRTALVRRLIEEFVNTGDVSRIADFVSPDCVETDGKVRIPSGISGMAERILGVRQTYPDLRLNIQRQIAEGEWVATQVLATGTHSGNWLGMTPTGKVLVMVAVDMDRIVSGRLVEHGGAASMLEPLLQAGAIKPV